MLNKYVYITIKTYLFELSTGYNKFNNLCLCRTYTHRVQQTICEITKESRKRD